MFYSKIGMEILRCLGIIGILLLCGLVLAIIGVQYEHLTNLRVRKDELENKIKDLEKENKELQKQNDELESELAKYDKKTKKTEKKGKSRKEENEKDMV